MDPNSLTEAQKSRLRACKSADELRALAEEQGIELSDAQLEAVSGGVPVVLSEDYKRCLVYTDPNPSCPEAVEPCDDYYCPVLT